MSPSPPSHAQLVLDAAAIDRTLRRIAHEIIEGNPDLKQVALVGIPTRGVEVARRIAAQIEHIEKQTVELGIVDVSMHRDDLRLRGKLSAVGLTQLPHDLTGRTIILVDDVLFSGRTCRAAMDALASFGRPARIQLAVLVDRGHRELPIRPDYIGKNLPTSLQQRVYVRFENCDGVPDSVSVEKE
ncbi:MAG: pyrimidine operon attenuation protein / uracil phosphoribosyltransferase [Chthoniobacter sp.]|jgi:pyrimidine operon attenuation protein/uracil phosphoribosyltransferase|nr:pyrimidine operon attenuation protein / uracil phosphoribosyltransferase [Chthoniobacter sp.]